jgi:hypothetical protein
MGKMEIYVDGRLLTTLNQYASSPIYQKKWIYSGTLTTGSHQLKLVFVSGVQSSLDAVSIP